MNKYTDDKIDNMLKVYCTREEEAYTFRMPSPGIGFKSIIAAVIAIVLLTGVCFLPNLFSNEDSGFVIVANATTLDKSGISSADEITTDNFVTLKSKSSNIVFFDFDEIINADAPQDDLVRKYLFQSFAQNLHIDVVGEDIETITYTPSQGVLSVLKCSSADQRYKCLVFDYKTSKESITIDYGEQDLYQIAFNPVYDNNSSYKEVFYFEGYDKVTEKYYYENKNYYEENEGNKPYDIVSEVGRGYRSEAKPVATEEEIAKLSQYSKENDMESFFALQNKIFERLVNDVTIDVTVTKTNGSIHTKTLQLCYIPCDSPEYEDYKELQYVSPSTGTISAKIIEE